MSWKQRTRFEPPQKGERARVWICAACRTLLLADVVYAPPTICPKCGKPFEDALDPRRMPA